MTSIERTAYPRFPRLMSARELHVFYTSTTDEVEWASAATESDGALLGLVLGLKCFQRMGRFPRQDEVPGVVVDHVRRCLDLGAGVSVAYGSDRTQRHHRGLIRKRVGVVCDPARARGVAAAVIREAAVVKNNPPDLINVALEMLVAESLELLGFTVLDKLASAIRGEVNREIISGIVGRISAVEGVGLRAVLRVGSAGGESLFTRMKKPAKRPSWSRFKEQSQYLGRVDELGDTAGWLQGVAESKIADFAAEAAAQDAGTLGDYDPVKRVALLACLVHTARARARDDLAEMLCKRVAVIVKKAKTELEEIRLRQRVVTERLIGGYKAVLEQLAPDGVTTATEAAAVTMAHQALMTVSGVAEPGEECPEGSGSVGEDGGSPALRLAGAQGEALVSVVRALKIQAEGLGAIRTQVAAAGGLQAQLADIEEVSAYHGDNHEMLVQRFFRQDRAVMFELAARLRFEATSADASVLDALQHALEHWTLTRDYIPDYLVTLDEKGKEVETRIDTSFASGNWQKVIRDHQRPGMLVRRHFEACVFTYLTEELRTGDVAVEGATEYANWAAKLLSWEQCQPKLADFCHEAGLPSTAEEFTADLRGRLERAAAELDAGYPDNTDLVIDDSGTPTLKRRVGSGNSDSAEALLAAIKARMPKRSLIGIVARTAFWLQWWRHFGPPSGSDPKLTDPQGRYALTTFVCGVNMTYADAANHLSGISAHELSATANRHVTIAKLNKATTDVINAFARLDVVKAWGDGTAVAADGTQIDTYIDNLLAESSIRYGGIGGIAYHYVSDTYIVLFSRFINCGAWEAIYLIDGLLQNTSDIKPDTIHADTQGQSFPVFTLAHLFGFDLIPRIRNWKDLLFFRPSAQTCYTHIDALFGDPGRNVIDWDLIRDHWVDLMKIGISIQRGTLSSVMLMRRLSSNSRKNQIYKAFREVGRVMRTVALLRYLGDSALRARVTAATNKAEAYNGFSAWLRFGNNGVIADNDPAEQEKSIKFNSLLADLVVFHTAVDMMTVIRALIAEGWQITAEDLAGLSPYLVGHIRRFGAYATDELHIPPDAFDPALTEVDFDAESAAA
ncbi:MAG: Tn3 family transposase [Pseudonocardiaceae bacterium]